MKETPEGRDAPPESPIRREQRLESQTVRQRLPGPNRQVQLAREQLIERLHGALVSHLESQGRVRLSSRHPRTA